MITLHASADYGHTGQFVARITGRHSKFTFEREFVGSKTGKRNEQTAADLDTPGLYEIRDVTRKGNVDRYVVLVLDAAGEMQRCKSDKEDAMKIAKAMEGGRAFPQIVRHAPENPEADYEILTASTARREETAQTLESAIDACWAILQKLPEKQAKKALSALRSKVSPKTAPTEDEC